jgi:hypothetical protein
MPIIDKNLEASLKELNISFSLWDDYMNDDVKEKDATSMNVYNFTDGFLDMKTLKLPKKKLVDFDWVMNKINSEKTYKNFTESFKKLLASKGYKNSINVYPTSYGIGVFVAMSYRNQTEEIKQNINELLETYRIDYTNESSDAGWVFRYKISKKKENIEKLNELSL